MNLVMLDGYTLNPGDLTWAPLERYGSLTVHARTEAKDVLSRAANAEIVLTNKTPLTASMIRQLPRLKYIGVLATGYNVVDTEAAVRQGITVTNIPGYSTQAVAQLVFAFMLEHCQHVQRHSDAVSAGEWVRCADFSFTRFPLLELAGKTIGIIGFGQIGQQVAAIAQAFGMNVLVQTRTAKQVPGLESVQFVPLEELLRASDFVSIHTALTPETNGLINKETLSRMKPTAYLINTARGGHIVEQDLADALNEGTLAGAGLDVLSSEPPSAANPLLAAKNCLITPHLAWATKEARSRLLEIAAANIEGYLIGSPQNVVAGPT